MNKEENDFIKSLGRTDIYLLDQLMRAQLTKEMKILDAGCGGGRNSELFVRNNFDIYGIDQNEEAIKILQDYLLEWNPSYDKARFFVASLSHIPFPNSHFDFIICSAVLHFCKDRQHFIQLFEELLRVLAPNGILWFRMTSKHTLEHFAKHLQDDVYLLPDESIRYLLDRTVLEELIQKHQLSWVDPFKTVNVSDIRTMSTVVLRR